MTTTSMMMMEMMTKTLLVLRKMEIFRLSRAWNKEKIGVFDGNRTHDLPFTGQAL